MQVSTASQSNRPVVIASVTTVAASIVALALAPQSVRGILSMGFLPHTYCYLYQKDLIALHVGSDAAIWLSYVSISVTLTYLVYRTRREVPFSWMLLAFGTFIIACGFTHLMEVVVLWKPLYWLSADVKLLTAVASLITALALPPLVPKVHEMLIAAEASDQRKAQIEVANQQLSSTNRALVEEVQKRTRTETELRTLSGRILALQDEERRRIARELHDSTGQLLTAIGLNLSLASQDSTAGTLLHRWIDDSIKLTERVIGEVRTMSYLLHPPMLEEAGLAVALRGYVEGFMQRSHLQIDLRISDELRRLPPDIELAAFRVVQECLTNVLRHSGSHKAEIVIVVSDQQLRVSVRDFGKGITALQPGIFREGNKIGVGLRGMAERVRQLRGHLEIELADPGTRIEAWLPVSVDNSEDQNAMSGMV